MKKEIKKRNKKFNKIFKDLYINEYLKEIDNGILFENFNYFKSIHTVHISGEDKDFTYFQIKYNKIKERFNFTVSSYEINSIVKNIKKVISEGYDLDLRDKDVKLLSEDTNSYNKFFDLIYLTGSNIFSFYLGEYKILVKYKKDVFYFYYKYTERKFEFIIIAFIDQDIEAENELKNFKTVNDEYDNILNQVNKLNVYMKEQIEKQQEIDEIIEEAFVKDGRIYAKKYDKTKARYSLYDLGSVESYTHYLY